MSEDRLRAMFEEIRDEANREKVVCGICPKCLEIQNKALTRHHVVPKRYKVCGNHYILLICRDCHDEIEQILPKERQLTNDEYWEVTRTWLKGGAPMVK